MCQLPQQWTFHSLSIVFRRKYAHRKNLTIILAFYSTKINFSWSSADPAGGAYSASPVPFAGLDGLFLKKRREWKKKAGERRGK